MGERGVSARPGARGRICGYLFACLVLAGLGRCGGDGGASPAPATTPTEAPTGATAPPSPGAQATATATPTPSGRRPPDAATPPPGQVRVASFTIPAGRLEAILAAASEFERTLLEDGVLTFAEYEQALFAGFACLQEKGMRVTHTIPWIENGQVFSDGREQLPGPRLTARGQYVYVIGSGSSDLAGSQLAVAECSSQYYDLIELLWAEATAPTERELQEITRLTGACMRERGLDVPENPTETDLLVAAYPPDGRSNPSLHRKADGSPVESVLALFDCRGVVRFQLGYE